MLKITNIGQNYIPEKKTTSYTVIHVQDLTTSCKGSSPSDLSIMSKHKMKANQIQAEKKQVLK